MPIEWNKEISLGRAIQFAITIIGALLIFYSHVESKFAVYDNMFQTEQKYLDQISQKLDQIQDQIVQLQIEMQNKENRKN